jgi:HprK-related kinase A
VQITLQSLTPQDLRSRLSGTGLPIRCGPLVMRLCTSVGELVDPLRLLYQDFPLADPAEVPDFAVGVAPTGLIGRIRGRAVAVIDGRPAFDPFRRRHALPMFEWAVNYCVFTRPNQYLLLHSAVVERGGSGLLLSGQPGAGKSTLTAGLVLRGWRLFSDEVAMVPPGTRDVLPLPRPVGLKEASIDVVRAFSSQAVIGPSVEGTRKGTVAHMRPPAESVARASEPASPRWVVFPRFVQDAAIDIRRISRAEALLRLGNESFNYSVLGHVGFETLADVVDGCACYELRFGDLSQAVRSLEELTT